MILPAVRFRRITSPLYVILALLAAIAGSAAPGMAQVVNGHLVQGGGGAPVAGAHVVLRDLGGKDVSTAESDAAGRFVLRAPAAGRYRILAERVGFSTTASPVLELGAGETKAFRLEAASARIQLDAIVVQGRTRCVARAGSGPETALLWDEARKALQSNRATNASGAFSFALQVYARELDRRGTVKQERRTTRQTSGNPFVTIAPERLQEMGYVQTAGDSLMYFGPDAELLLSPAFQDDHCFWVQAPAASEPGLLGLGFEPLPGAFRRSDIRGTLWLDRATAQLRRVDYQYTHLPWMREPSDQAGGAVRFRQIGDGRWIVDRWAIRMPVVTSQRIGSSVQSGDPMHGDLERRIVGVHEEGGEVVSVSSSGGPAQDLRTGSATLAGVVYDSSRAGPLAGARVSLAGTGFGAATDSAGRYLLRDLPAGEYRVHLASPRLDSLGYVPPEVPAAVREGAESRRDLTVPPLRSVLAASCVLRPNGITAPLVGVVRGAGGRPVAGLPLTVGWTPEGGEPQSLASTTDEAGVFRICAAPAGVALRITIERADGSITVSGLSLTPGVPRLQEIDVPAAQQASSAPAATPAAGRMLLRGTVRDAVGRPVRGAGVRVGAGTEQATDSLGQFTVRLVTPGMQPVRVTAPGAGERTAQVQIAADAAEMDLRLGAGTPPTLTASVRRVVRLQGVTARGESRVGSLETTGFYERRRTGLGAYLTDAEIHRNPSGTLTSVLRTIAGIRVVRFVNGGNSGDIVDQYRIASGHGSTRIGTEPCYMDVYMDGVKVQDALSPASAMNLDAFSLAAVTGIEAYRGAAEAPPQYRSSTSACGVVLLWTRTADRPVAPQAPVAPPAPPTRPPRP